MGEHNWLAERFEASRTHLRVVSYRMLGCISTERFQRSGERWPRTVQSRQRTPHSTETRANGAQVSLDVEATGKPQNDEFSEFARLSGAPLQKCFLKCFHCR